MELSRLLGQRKNGLFVCRDLVAPGSAILSDGMYAQSGEDLGQRVEIDRFGDTPIATCILNTFRISEGGISGDSHNRQVRKVFLPARPMNQSEAIRAAEMDVQEYRFRKGFRCNEDECRFESVREYGLKTLGFQPAGQKFAKQRVIFDDENSMFHLAPEFGSTPMQSHDHPGALNH
jgi:hypothetical protein